MPFHLTDGIGGTGICSKIVISRFYVKQLEEKYRLRWSAVSLQGLMDKVARYYKIEAENLKSSSKERRVTEARRILCYLAVRELRYKCSDVSKAMGISAAKVSKVANLGSKLSGAGQIQKLILDN
jgi:chromosomal replication initiation ATPase DnaA